MQCGIPVLVSSAPALSEVVANAGIVLPANNKTAWTESLRRILEILICGSSISNAAARALDFSWDKCARETIAVYQTTLACHVVTQQTNLIHLSTNILNTERQLIVASASIFTLIFTMYMLSYSGTFTSDDEQHLASGAQTFAIEQRLSAMQVYGNPRLKGSFHEVASCVISLWFIRLQSNKQD